MVRRRSAAAAKRMPAPQNGASSWLLKRTATKFRATKKNDSRKSCQSNLVDPVLRLVRFHAPREIGRRLGDGMGDQGRLGARLLCHTRMSPGDPINNKVIVTARSPPTVHQRHSLKNRVFSSPTLVSVTMGRPAASGCWPHPTRGRSMPGSGPPNRRAWGPRSAVDGRSQLARRRSRAGESATGLRCGG